MKNYRYLKVSATIALFIFGGIGIASANQNYTLSVTNGSDMPISGGVVYVVEGQRGTAEIGDAPSAGLVRLCQMGDPSVRLSELQANAQVKWVSTTAGPVLPGQTAAFDVSVPHAFNESVHFEAMYGESKELCASIRVTSLNLRTLALPGIDEVLGTDQVISAGAATEPALPMGSSLAGLCSSSTSAIACLRTLSIPRVGTMQIHRFAGYLPSLIDFLESKYGATDVESLLIPHSGALNYSVKLK